ncbi:MAG: ZIP family metal transporter, partial [Alistipes sp.]|nr:ZIP family metal transporter [Alistipes sp.]
MMNTAIGVLLPFIGTALGAAMVFFLRDEISPRLQKILLGFASGVMMAASVWSLLLPAIDIASEQNMIAWLPAAVGFVGGMLFLLLLDTLIPHLHVNSNEAEGIQSKLGRSAKLMLAVTLHNIPEGMAVGVVLAGAMVENAGITFAGAMALSLGIAIQNFPEGAIISMPIKGDGNSKGRSFLYGMLSGIVEPIAAVITIVLIDHLLPALPFLL